GVIFEHVDNVLHDLTHYETLVDVNRLIGDKKVKDAIVDRHGTEYFQFIKNSLRDIAAGNVQSQRGIESILSYLRGGVAVSTMGFSGTTAAKQASGIFQGMSYIGVVPTLRGLTKLAGGAAVLQNQISVIQEKSAFMKTRIMTHN